MCRTGSCLISTTLCLQKKNLIAGRNVHSMLDDHILWGCFHTLVTAKYPVSGPHVAKLNISMVLAHGHWKANIRNVCAMFDDHLIVRLWGRQTSHRRFYKWASSKNLRLVDPAFDLHVAPHPFSKNFQKDTHLQPRSVNCHLVHLFSCSGMFDLYFFFPRDLPCFNPAEISLLLNIYRTGSLCYVVKHSFDDNCRNEVKLWSSVSGKWRKIKKIQKHISFFDATGMPAIEPKIHICSV